jgi:hypothetical protein
MRKNSPAYFAAPAEENCVPPKRSKTISRREAAAIAMLVVLAGAVGWIRPWEAAIGPPKSRLVGVAVLPFDNMSSDRYALDVLQTTLTGLSSRLFKTIREDEGLAYYTGFYSSRGIQEGFLAFYAGTKPDAAKKVEALMKKERQNSYQLFFLVVYIPFTFHTFHLRPF